MIYCWGSNSCGQFGNGSSSDSFVPTPTKDFEFESIFAGSRCAFGVTKTGELYASGANDHGQLGVPTLQLPSSLAFFQVPVPETAIVSQVACGWSHTLLLSRDGRVLVCGDGGKGQLGCGPDIRSLEYFRHLPFHSRAVQVGCGLWSSFILLETGSMCFFGQNREFASEQTLYPVNLPQFHNIRKFAIGHRHILALSNDGKLRGFGSNGYSQIPEESDITKEVKDIFAGWNHSIILFKDSELLLIGKNDYNQLAHEDPKARKNVLKFNCLEQIAAGSDHTLVFAEGKLFVWGWNEHGILGLGHDLQLFGSPILLDIDGNEIRNVFCGGASCFLITSE